MLRVYLLAGLLVFALVLAGLFARHFYNAGQEEIRAKQERKLQDLEERSNSVKEDALRTPDADVDERLRRDARPDP